MGSTEQSLRDKTSQRRQRDARQIKYAINKNQNLRIAGRTKGKEREEEYYCNQRQRDGTRK
jgi:hypothetical protein